MERVAKGIASVPHDFTLCVVGAIQAHSWLIGSYKAKLFRHESLPNHNNLFSRVLWRLNFWLGIQVPSYLLTMVFCFQNCSDFLWEKKIVLVIEKTFWNLRLNIKNLQKVWDHLIIYLNNERSDCFFNLFLEVSQI